MTYISCWDDLKHLTSNFLVEHLRSVLFVINWQSLEIDRDFMGWLDHISQVVQKEVREGYLGTNQGLVVSMAICNLHAMAEGARLTLFLGGCHFVVFFQGKSTHFFFVL